MLYHLPYIMMVQTRSKVENYSNEELFEELIHVEDICSKLCDQMERNKVKNAQYHCHESLEINPVPTSNNNDQMMLSLTGHEVKPNYLQPCQCLKKRTLQLLNLNVRSKTQHPS